MTLRRSPPDAGNIRRAQRPGTHREADDDIVAVALAESPQRLDLLPFQRQRGTATMAYSPLGSGAFAAWRCYGWDSRHAHTDHHRSSADALVGPVRPPLTGDLSRLPRPGRV